MKRIVFILILGLMPLLDFAQKPVHPDTSRVDTAKRDTIADTVEAGGISPDAVASENKETMHGLVMGLIGGAAGVLLMFGITYYVHSKKKTKEAAKNDSKLFIDESVAPQASSKEPGATDLRKLKEEIKVLKLKLEEAKNETAAYKKNLDIHKEFDQKYYTEAFRKLVSPMSDVLEKGSRKEIIESLLKIMSHYSSLTRYKIEKKQPYDEANMQYLMNQRTKNDVAIEIDANTPIDKIPKNIKPLIDLLQEQSSHGLDESIIAGYKIKNL
jgi:hypothetical protein